MYLYVHILTLLVVADHILHIKNDIYLNRTVTYICITGMVFPDIGVYPSRRKLTWARKHRVYISFFTFRLAIIIHVSEEVISKPILGSCSKALFTH
jgi:hypothetical protein